MSQKEPARMHPDTAVALGCSAFLIACVVCWTIVRIVQAVYGNGAS